MPDASVVIATRDRADRLDACLARLARQSAAGAFEVLVVDNGSSDGTPQVIDAAQRRGDPVRALFVADPNRGKARNAGIAEAAGDVVIFCDDDTLAPPHFVESHMRARAARPRAVVSGPIINVADERTLPAPGPQHFSRAFLCTCNASVTRTALLEVGGFDERYDLYGWEDTDLGVRLRRNGAQRVWTWDAYLYHVKPPAHVTLASRIALAKEKGAMAARFVRKSPTFAVRLATGAYAANFGRAALLGMPAVRRLFERVAGATASPRSAFATFAADSLVDSAYVEELRAALRRGDG